MLKCTLINHDKAKRRQESTHNVFDADDVGYVLSKFNLPQLRRELRTADVQASVCRQYHDPAEHYWKDYAAAIKLAINIAHTKSPGSKWDSRSKRRSQKGGGWLPRASDVKARYDVVDVISQYVDLHKAGRNFKGLCPFHHDSDPSLMIYPDNQRWWCYSCNIGGDVINFTMHYHNMDFKEAIKYLARSSQ